MKQKPDESDVRFRKLIEHNYSGITLLNADFEIGYRSRSAERITGWTTAKRILNPFIALIHPDDQQGVVVVLENTRQTSGLSLTVTFRAMHYDGHYIWLESTYTNMLEEPDVHAIVCNFRDVTEQKETLLKLNKQSEQINELLETMTDSFIALDENLCYTYANQQVSKLLKRPASSLVGQYIWTLFPDAVGSATYQAIQTAFTEKTYVRNEDFYAPLQLWQENRVYPSAGGVSVFIRDITKQKKEEHHLKLLESVITNTTDAVLITEAEPFDEPGPRILYVNEAFTKMTGYTSDEVIGKTPRILQGPKTDKRELIKLGECMRLWESCEVTLINYKKSGEEFWINFTLNPVADEKGWFTHWISIDRDVTERKKEELEKSLLAEVSQIFNEPAALHLLLDKLLLRLAVHGNFLLAEVWLVSVDKNRISLTSYLSGTADIQPFYDESDHFKSFEKGEGLPGATWASGTLQVWDHLDERKDFLRMEAAKLVDLKKAYGVPLLDDNKVIGVLLLGMRNDQQPDNNLTAVLKAFGTHFGAEIKRKQVEQDLDQVFNFAPDIIAIVGTDRFFKKVNKAMSTLLEYTHAELLSMPMNALVHPDDLVESKIRTQGFINAAQTTYFENRFMTKSGKVKWISWTATRGTEEGLIFCVGKDITDKKDLEQLLNKVTDLARIGGWEVDLVKQTLYWSKITREIHEVATDYVPDLATGISFYKEGKDRVEITQYLTDSIEKGTAFDMDLQIVTAKGNAKWVRLMGEPEFAGGKCVRIYGSFQDVDARVIAEALLKESEKRYGELFQLSPLPKWLFDLETLRFLDVNKAATNHYGYTREEFLTMTIKDIRPLDDVPALLNVLADHQSQQQFAVPGIVTHKKKNGEKMLIEIQSNDIAYKGRKARIIVANDITERINYIKAIETQNEKLKEISWMQSHVIRAPLSRIMGLINLLNEVNQSPEELNKIADYIQTSAFELDKVIRDITDITNKEA